MRDIKMEKASLLPGASRNEVLRLPALSWRDQCGRIWGIEFDFSKTYGDAYFTNGRITAACPGDPHHVRNEENNGISREGASLAAVERLNIAPSPSDHVLALKG